MSHRSCHRDFWNDKSKKQTLKKEENNLTITASFFSFFLLPSGCNNSLKLLHSYIKKQKAVSHFELNCYDIQNIAKPYSQSDLSEHACICRERSESFLFFDLKKKGIFQGSFISSYLQCCCWSSSFHPERKQKHRKETKCDFGMHGFRKEIM